PEIGPLVVRRTANAVYDSARSDRDFQGGQHNDSSNSGDPQFHNLSGQLVSLLKLVTVRVRHRYSVAKLACAALGPVAWLNFLSVINARPFPQFRQMAAN